LKKNNQINAMFMTNGVSARSNNKMKINKRKKACLNLFKYLKLQKPIFFNFPDNQMDKVPLLKIVNKIEKKINTLKPDVIFTHFYGCLNIDHRLTYEATITACRPIGKSNVNQILSFEIPSSTDWAYFKNKKFEPNFFIEITKELNEKIKLLQFYKDELRKYPHSRSIKSIKSLASYRGSNCGKKYAEAFYLNRHIL